MADCAHLAAGKSGTVGKVGRKTGSYMRTRRTNSLPEGLSEVRQEKQHSMTGARLGSQKYSLLFNFHRRA